MGNHAGRRLTILFTIIILMITGCQSGFAIGKDAVGTFTQIHVKGDISFDYQLYVPDGSDKMPLVILFHGYGEAENVLNCKIPTTLTGEEKQAEYPCYIMAPQIENNVFLAASSRKSLYDELKTEAERLVKAGRVDGDRIYIMGYSFGGLATTEFAENYPDYIAAAIVMCPALTYDDSSTQNLKLMKDVPMWFAHAGGDNVIPVNVSRSAVSTLEALGAPEVHYTEFSDEEMKTAGAMYGYHQADYAVMADEQFMNWLFGKKKK